MVTTIAISTLLVVLCVVIHFEALQIIPRVLRKLPLRPRRRLSFAVLGALLAHIVEIEVFAAGYYALCRWEKFGKLVPAPDKVLGDYSYFSFVVYTSLGFGDILPVGPIRYVVAVETLTGLVLIGWTASFMFLQMQAHWDKGG